LEVYVILSYRNNNSMSYKNNRIERLPHELRYYIAEYVPSKREQTYPYIVLFKDIMLDWYNKYRVWDNSDVVYRSYDEIYKKGISQEESPFFKLAFNRYQQESKYYSMTMLYQVGQFQKIAQRYQRRRVVVK